MSYRRAIIFMCLLGAGCGSSGSPGSPGAGGSGGGGGQGGSGTCGAKQAMSFSAPSEFNGPLPAVALDTQGDAITAAFFTGTAQIGSKSLTAAGQDGDTLVAKVDATGSVLWVRALGATSGTGQVLVATDGADNVILGGSFSGDMDLGTGPLSVPSSDLEMFVAKLDATGKTLWVKGLPGAIQSYVSALAVDSASGAITLAGYVDVPGGTTFDFGGGPRDLHGTDTGYLMRMDGTGKHVFSETFNGAASTAGLALEADGGVLMTGGFTGTLDLGGGALTDAGKGDVFAARFDANGQHVWSARFGDAERQSANGIAKLPSGAFVICGTASGSPDFGGGPVTTSGAGAGFFAGFDASGKHLFSHALPGGATAFGTSALTACTADASGTVRLGGWFRGSIDAGGTTLASNDSQYDDALVATLDDHGAITCAKAYGGDFDVLAFSMATAAGGATAVAGGFAGKVTFGASTLQAVNGPSTAGTSDVFIARF